MVPRDELDLLPSEFSSLVEKQDPKSNNGHAGLEQTAEVGEGREEMGSSGLGRRRAKLRSHLVPAGQSGLGSVGEEEAGISNRNASVKTWRLECV